MKKASHTRAQDKAIEEAILLLDFKIHPKTGAIRSPTKTEQKRAVKILEPLALAGHPKAQLHLGLCYIAGDGVQCDESVGVEWMEKAAHQGFDEAQFRLADYYQKKYQSWQDRSEKVIQKAHFWMKKASDQGYYWALLNDAVETCTLRFQRTLDKQFQQALTAAKKGDAEAMKDVSLLYSAGIGVKPDQEASVYWRKRFEENKQAYIRKLELLSEKGDERAQLKLSSLTTPSLLEDPEAFMADTDAYLKKLQQEEPAAYKRFMKSASKIQEFGPMPSSKPKKKYTRNKR